jgi:type I restriction enzyme S subunit
MGVLKLNCIQENRFSPEKNKAVADSRINDLKTPVSKNTLIVSRSNTEDLVGAVCYVEHDVPNLFLSDLLWRISAKDEKKIDLKWLSYLLSYAPYRGKIIARANGTSDSMKKITKDGFLGIRIVFPEIDEQRKIAQILSTWDIAIDQIRKQITAKKNRKKALMQHVLAGSKTSDWKATALDKAFKRIQRLATDAMDDILSITSNVGFVHQNDRFNRVIAGKNLNRYILLKKGEFAYNKGNSKSYPQGCVYMLQEYEYGAVPNVYICFKPRIDGIHGRFYKYYFEAGLLNHQLYRVINTGVRNDGLLNLNPKDFFNLKILVPPLKEQRRIADIFAAIDLEIVSLKSKLAALENQKRGLMQKLLTGEVRVKI